MKIKLFVAFLIWFFVFENKANAQWQTIFKDSANYWCASVYFLNNDTGFVGTYYTSGFNTGTIFRTLDGGQSWDTSLVTFMIFSIHFINDSMGFAGGQDGAVYSTTDMGENWNYAGGLCCDDMFSLYFLNQNIGYKSSIGGTGIGNIYRTTNGGVSWSIIFNPQGSANWPGTSRMLFIDSLTGYLAQSGYNFSTSTSISKTTDGGLSWIDLNIPNNFSPNSAYFFDSIKGVAVGYLGKISYTFDSGISWSSPDSIGPYPLLDVRFVNDSIGYIIGGHNIYTSLYTNGIIYKTINAGITWQVMDSSYFDGLLKLHFPSDSIGYAVGMNGIILKITNANSVTSSVEVISNPQSVITIFPNPATNEINISGFAFNVGDKISVLDPLGKVIFTKVFSAPAANCKLSTASLSNGMYFLSVETMSNGERSRTMVVKKVVVQH